MKKSIIEVCHELLELEKKATPGPWLEAWEGDYPIIFSKDIEMGKEVDIAIPDNLLTIVLTRNHIRSICLALKEAHEALHHYGTYIARSDDGTSAREWLKKWGASDEGGGE